MAEEGASRAPGALEPAEEARLSDFLDLIAAVAGGDTSRRATILGDGSLLDGIGTGLNMMAEELAEREARERLV